MIATEDDNQLLRGKFVKGNIIMTQYHCPSKMVLQCLGAPRIFYRNISTLF